jgi:uncharacterized protein YjbI with pentapeptide repeats
MQISTEITRLVLRFIADLKNDTHQNGNFQNANCLNVNFQNANFQNANFQNFTRQNVNSQNATCQNVDSQNVTIKWRITQPNQILRGYHLGGGLTVGVGNIKGWGKKFDIFFFRHF